MAYKSCAAQIAASIAQDCNKPLVGGYTGRAVIIPANDFAMAEVVVDAANPRKILSVVLPPDGSIMAYTIDNVFATPFTGSSTTGNADTGRNGYLKTLSVRVPMRGADTSMKVVEPLIKSADGFVVIAEKRDRVGDGSFEVIGYQNALRGDIASVTRDENANGGDWVVNLTTIEKWAEVALVGNNDDYETAKKEFEGLFGFEPMVMSMTTSIENQEFFRLSANGLVYIDSIKGGEKVRKTLVSPNAEFVTINNDADTEIVIWGAVTFLSAGDDANTGLTSLDLSKNTALTYLDCYGCTGLTSLDLSKNTALTNLNCYGCTGLTLLDLSKNIALTHLDCGSCTELTSLDLSKNTALTNLYCYGCTGLTSLDLSKNTALTNLRCNECTGLTSLDLSKNIALTELRCNECTGLTSLDLSKNIALTKLYCNGCTGLTSLDLSKNTALTELSFYICTGLTSLDLSKNIALTKLYCNGCTELMLLDIQNTASLSEGTFADDTMTALTTIQLNGTSEWAQGEIGGWLEQYAPTGGKLYANQDTLQEVLVAAESKNWEVIYVA